MVLLTLEKASSTHPQCSLGRRTPTPRSLRSLGRSTGHRSLTTEWRVCVDPDVSEAARIAGGILRLTLASGRESRPHSHWWYVTPKARPRSRGRRRHDAAGASLHGCRALVAPTVHIAGNRYIWHSETELETTQIDAAELRNRLRKLATTVLMTRHPRVVT
jgi:hypothetical protein